MKLLATSVIVFVLGLTCESASAEPPPLDRPTPPPCCADGQCIARPESFGYYDTRWRRWPLELPAPLPGAKTAPLPTNLQPEIPRFEPPPAEEEDRKAPPPTITRPEETPSGGPSGTTSPRPGGATLPALPPQMNTGAQPRNVQPTQPSPMGPRPQPAPSETPSEQPRVNPLLRSPVPQSSPLLRSGPTSDMDLPPSPPIASTLPESKGSFREIKKIPSSVRSSNYDAASTLAPVSPLSKPAVQAPASDPPPAPPITRTSFDAAPTTAIEMLNKPVGPSGGSDPPPGLPDSLASLGD